MAMPHAILAVVAGLLVGFTSASEPDTCTPGAKGCIALTDDELAMIQHKAAGSENIKRKAVAAGSALNVASNGAKRRKQAPNATAVWEQLKGCVQIEGLLSQSNITAEQQTTLDSLKAKFPSYEEIQEQFDDQWDNITDAVNMQNLQGQLEEAQKDGSALANSTVAELQEQYDALKGQLPDDFNLDNIQAETADLWDQMQDTLPDLDSLASQAQQAASQAFDEASNAVSDVMQGFFR